MSLIPLSGLLKTASAGFTGYGEDKQLAIKELLQQAAEKRAADKAALDLQIGQRDLARLAPGDVGYGARHNQQLEDEIPGMAKQAGAVADAKVPAAVEEERLKAPIRTEQARAQAAAVSPITTATAVNTAAGEAPIAIDKAKAIHKYETEHPANAFTTFQDTDPVTKVPQTRLLNTHTGAVTTEGGGKVGGPGGGGSSLLPADRTKMYEQAKLDDAEMTRVEDRVLAKQLNFGTAAGLARAAAGAHGSTTGEMVGVLGNAAAGAIDPDIQTYITANKSYGRIMGNLQSKRYTDNQAAIEQDISGMKGNDLANTIAYKRRLRAASLADVNTPPHSPDDDLAAQLGLRRRIPK